jgi:hypothetical protein
MPKITVHANDVRTIPTVAIFEAKPQAGGQALNELDFVTRNEVAQLSDQLNPKLW